MISKCARLFSRCWIFVLPSYLLAAAVLDPGEVSNADYLKFVLTARHPALEYWSHGRIASGKENDPVVLVTYYDAAAYCRWVGRRLPTFDEWRSTCGAGKLKKRGDLWEWT